MTWAIFKAEIEVSKACYSSLSSKVYGLGISKFLVRRARFFSVATVSRSHPGVPFSGLSAWYLMRISWIWFVMAWNLLLETLSKLKVFLLKFKTFALNSRISRLNLNFWKLCCAGSRKIGEKPSAPITALFDVKLFNGCWGMFEQSENGGKTYNGKQN